MRTSLRTAVCGVLLAGTGMTGMAVHAQSAPPSASSQRDARMPVPVIVAAPLAGTGQPARNPHEGCWVRLKDNVGKAKGNEYMTIMGSKYMPDLKTAAGEDWAQKMDGIDIGPDALVTVFGEPDYGGRGVILRPNQVVQDFRKDLGFVNAIASMKLDCKA